jgi:hypothetical protein
MCGRRRTVRRHGWERMMNGSRDMLRLCEFKEQVEGDNKEAQTVTSSLGFWW